MGGATRSRAKYDLQGILASTLLSDYHFISAELCAGFQPVESEAADQEVSPNTEFTRIDRPCASNEKKKEVQLEVKHLIIKCMTNHHPKGEVISNARHCHWNDALTVSLTAAAVDKHQFSSRHAHGDRC